MPLISSNLETPQIFTKFSHKHSPTKVYVQQNHIYQFTEAWDPTYIW